MMGGQFEKGMINTMINKTLGKIGLFAFLLLGFIAVSSPAIYAAATTKPSSKKHETSKPKSKKIDITQEKAQQIALKRAKGTVESGELKTEKGKEVYAFAIRDSKGKVRDIWVDPKNGKVVHDSMEKK